MRKALSLILAAAVIANFLGLVFGIVRPLTFWVVTIVAAVTAYWILPKLSKSD